MSVPSFSFILLFNFLLCQNIAGDEKGAPMHAVNLNKEELKEGDIIFISIPNALYSRIAKLTHSPASHVGILLKNDKSQWVVAESTVPFSKYTHLDKFLARSDKGWVCIRRLNKEFSAEELQSVKAECDKRMGKLYHTGFKYNSRRQFCSKFVYDVFLNAAGVRIGKLESFKYLFSKSPETSLTFWKCWYFGFIPWSRVTVTPGSQMDSGKLVTVCQK